MSLLDTFSLIFDTDAGDASDDVDRLADSLDDTADSGDKSAKSLDKNARSAKDAGAGFGGLAKALVPVIAGFVSFQALAQTAAATDKLGKFTEVMGLSIEEVDAWGAAVELNGGSLDSFTGSVESLNSALTDISITGGGDMAETLSRLGVSAMDSSGKIKTATQLLPELADAFQELSEREAVGFGGKLGLDQGTILLLQQGRNAVQSLVEQQRQLGGRTQAGYEAAAEFNDEMSNTRRIFTGISDTTSQKLLPALSWLLRGLQGVIGWMQKHSDVIEGFFIIAASAITYFYLPAIISAAAATWAAIAPFVAIGAAIAAVGIAFAVLYEDVKAYLGGQESFIGKLAAKYEWFGDILDSVIGFASRVMGAFSDAGEAMADKLSGVINGLGEIFSKIFGAMGVTLGGFDGTAKLVSEGVAGYFQLLGDIIVGILKFISAPIETTTQLIKDLIGLVPSLDAVTDKVGNAWQGTKDFFGFGDDSPSADEMKQLEQQSRAAINASVVANSNPILAGTTSNSRNVNINQTNNFTSQVDARGMDRQQAVAAFNENRDRETSQTLANIQDGLAY